MTEEVVHIGADVAKGTSDMTASSGESVVQSASDRGMVD